MSKRAPSTGQLLAIVVFALSCFGILLFLWVTFGGPTPYKAQPYEIKVPFTEATQLAPQSDVRISGVNVGSVKSIDVSPDRRRSIATIDIDDKYGPLPRDTRAILRTKTIAGETYVELTPGSSRGPVLADGGTLPLAQVAESVQLDEIFRTFDARTRAAFKTWMQEAAVAVEGRGQDISNAFAELQPTFTEFDRLFRILDTQRLALRQLFSNGAVALRALRGREGQLAGLIRSSNAVFSTTARRDRDIEALFRAFPTFEDESKLTLERLRSFAVNADPLMKQLVPAAEQLSPTLVAFANLAPEAKGFFEGLERVIDLAPRGFPAAQKLFREEFPPLLRAIDPFLRNLNPVLVGLDLYKHEITAAMGNVAAVANAVKPSTATGHRTHYLRALGPLGPESVATFLERLGINRNSAYSHPLATRQLAQGLPSYETRQCEGGLVATLDPETAKNPDFNTRTGGDVEKAEDFFERLKKFAFDEQLSTADVPAPVCKQQSPFKPIFGTESPTLYQHTYAQGK